MKTVGPIEYRNTIVSLVVAASSLLSFSQNAYAISAEELCERPNFKLWKQQQMNRMWEPSQETRYAEKAGAVFTYNCFTSNEIDQFYMAHGERVENAHFIPILENRNSASAEDQDDSGECD